ncbi:MAG TPA: TetR family transcriptional regulator [Acidimicrobiales bacterium]|jgi:AcrR family transcriptional regulator|nr:TetR family transcriptional regulator [Acidimicrobiales bacterium]
MPTVGLRERKKEQTRDALAQAALELFAERGFDQVTVEEIAAACDVSPRTFFRYFGSKEDVLFADSDRRCDHLLASIAEQDPAVPAFDALAGAVRELAGDYAPEGERLRARHAILRSTPSLASRNAERQQGWEGKVIDALRTSGRARGMSDLDLRLMVASTTTALRVAIEDWTASAGEGDLQRRVDAALHYLRVGLGGD